MFKVFFNFRLYNGAINLIDNLKGVCAMKRKISEKLIISFIAVVMIAGTLASCGSAARNSATSSSDKSVSSVKNESESTDNYSSVLFPYTGNDDGIIDTTSLFAKRDLEQTADISAATRMTVENDRTIEITEDGVYVISGTASNCTIKVIADDSAKVQLVLDVLTVTNDDFPVIYVLSADEVLVTTTEGTSNCMTVTGAFKADGDSNTDAVIFSKEDIVFNGLGTLKITSSGNGIAGKDDVRFTGGTYDINADNNGIEGKNYIAVCGGTFTIDAARDGIKAQNDDDYTLGYIYIGVGKFTICVGSDGVKANTVVQIDDAALDISRSSEGIEAAYIQINGGTVNVYASDDCLNAVQESTLYDATIEINGGNITVEVGPGDTDALDSNGSIYVNGGTVNVTAPTSSFDYENKAEFNGGTIIINGEEVSEIPKDMMGGVMIPGQDNFCGWTEGQSGREPPGKR